MAKTKGENRGAYLGNSHLNKAERRRKKRERRVAEVEMVTWHH